MSAHELPHAEFGFPGALRDRLVAAILAGEKTSTTGLHEEFVREGLPVIGVGGRELVADSDGRGVAIIENHRGGDEADGRRRPRVRDR